MSVAREDAILADAPAKVHLTELMPTPQAARSQALLALAALKTGRQDWAQWLAARAELLVDSKSLCESRPILRDLWTKQD